MRTSREAPSQTTARDSYFSEHYPASKKTISCQKIGGTYQELIKAFREVYDVSINNAFTELTNIRMFEGESIAASQTDTRACFI